MSVSPPVSATFHTSKGTGDSFRFVAMENDDAIINMTESNVMAVLTALGFNSDLEGPLPSPQEFWAACERYLTSDIACLVDSGAEAVEIRTNGATIVECGRRPGYITEKVTLLRDRLASAMLLGCDRCYFA